MLSPGRAFLTAGDAQCLAGRERLLPPVRPCSSSQSACGGSPYYLQPDAQGLNPVDVPSAMRAGSKNVAGLEQASSPLKTSQSGLPGPGT